MRASDRIGSAERVKAPQAASPRPAGSGLTFGAGQAGGEGWARRALDAVVAFVTRLFGAGRRAGDR